MKPEFEQFTPEEYEVLSFVIDSMRAFEVRTAEDLIEVLQHFLWAQRQ